MSQANVQFDVIRVRRTALIVAGVGTAASVALAAANQRAFWAGYLVAFLYWWSMSLGALGLLMLHNLVGGVWGANARPIWRAALATLPVAALLFVPLALGLDQLYPWATSGAAADEFSELKRRFLSESFVLMRAAGYFVVWFVLAWAMGRRAAGSLAGVTPALRGGSAFGLVTLVLAMTFASIDWVMSLEPHWYSTIFGGLFVADGGLAGLTLTICGLALLKRDPSTPAPTTQTFNDLGNLLLAFVMLWAYFAFSQFLIIWAGNLPEEISWYLKRLRGGWQWLALASVVIHFALPFVMLFSRDVKQSAQSLVRVALLIAAARYLDLYWTVAPSLYPDGLEIHLAALVSLAAAGGWWLAAFCAALPRCSTALAEEEQPSQQVVRSAADQTGESEHE